MKKIINIKIFALIFLLLFLPLFVGCWGVPPTNESPTITSTPITVATVDELYTYDVDATDPDDDTLTYTLTTSPIGMTINSTTGVINWTPTSAQIGDNNVTAKVSDGSLNGTQSFVIVVSITTENQPPTITSTPINAATVGVLYTYYVNATDPDDDTLTYSLTTNPSGMTINSSTGVINWTPTSAQIGDNNVTAKVSDGDLFDTQSFIITVNPPCDAGKPTVITNDVTNIEETTVTANGNITATGGENCTVRGFQYGLTQTPTWDVQSSGSFGTGSYSEGLSGLTCETTYYVRAYTTNCAGTSYGEWKSFITAVCPPPQVTTNDASSITPTSAQLNGNLDSTGGLSCQVWFEYGETTSYGSSTTKQSKSSVGSFNQAISSLDSDTTYHFRACASNTGETVQGADKEFTTTIVTPNLKLTPATQSIPIGTEGTVNIVVEDVTNLMGADITLNFDDSKLKYDSSAPGSLWSPEGLLIFSPLATGGSVNIQLSAEVANAKTGSGTIITVAFERIASGVTNICFGSTNLRDEAWQVITHTKGGCCSFTE